MAEAGLSKRPADMASSECHTIQISRAKFSSVPRSDHHRICRSRASLQAQTLLLALSNSEHDHDRAGIQDDLLSILRRHDASDLSVVLSS